MPLDPASWTAVQRCLAHWENLRTGNPHLMVTKGTKAGRNSASVAPVSHVLDPAGISPRTIRSTRLIDLVNTMDAKLVAAAFDMNPEGVMIYLADHVDDGRLAHGKSKVSNQKGPRRLTPPSRLAIRHSSTQRMLWGRH
ncbi:hypothetical protein [Nonomuraea gerenzanensis]|uniref:Uncharacterized protein n=1 Tax=Nonomuraea gerenzanensis TaxID=93944 RepID=A0A1M4EJK5_9ACTN|nr:hypothetical protein [Nonomuraea gerenzanensis]UBU10368.1 hypothetical protein LCN96_39395 [Nonomuraea gerenzanensis]SBO98763.1 hypothetical protein BN4615_P8279 [Nonomuraea gerenzanensis]